jgi:hypothetical protein
MNRHGIYFTDFVKTPVHRLFVRSIPVASPKYFIVVCSTSNGSSCASSSLNQTHSLALCRPHQALPITHYTMILSPVTVLLLSLYGAACPCVGVLLILSFSSLLMSSPLLPTLLLLSATAFAFALAPC